MLPAQALLGRQQCEGVLQDAVALRLSPTCTPGLSVTACLHCLILVYHLGSCRLLTAGSSRHKRATGRP